MLSGSNTLCFWLGLALLSAVVSPSHFWGSVYLFIYFHFLWVMMGDDKMNADFLPSSSGLQIVSVRFRPVMDLQKQTPQVLHPWHRAIGFPQFSMELKGLTFQLEWSICR